MAGAYGVGFAGFTEPFPAVLPQRLELAESGLAVAAGGGDEGLVDQPAEHVEDLAGRHLVVGADGLGRGEPAAAGERGQPGEQAAFVGEQQIIAPVHHRAECLLAGQGGAGAPAEQPDPEAIQYLRDGHARGKVVVNL